MFFLVNNSTDHASRGAWAGSSEDTVTGVQACTYHALTALTAELLMLKLGLL